MGYKVFTSEVLTSADVNNYLMKQVDIKCTSTTRPASPIDGMLIFETDTRNTLRYDGSTSTWRVWPGNPTSNADGTNITGITSTSYAAGSPTCSITFTGPMGGAGTLFVKGVVEGASSTGATFVSAELRVTNSAGAVVVAAADSESVYTQGLENVSAGNWRYISGLTPGQVYYARTMHRVDTSGGNVYYRGIMWMPQPN